MDAAARDLAAKQAEPPVAGRLEPAQQEQGQQQRQPGRPGLELTVEEVAFAAKLKAAVDQYYEDIPIERILGRTFGLSTNAGRLLLLIDKHGGFDQVCRLSEVDVLITNDS